MAVLFPNHQVRTASHLHPMVRDAHGQPITTAEPEWSDAHPGSILERPGLDPNRGQEWTVKLDPAHWPLEEDDFLTCEDGRVWVIKEPRFVKIEHYGTELIWHIQGTAILKVPEVP